MERGKRANNEYGNSSLGEIRRKGRQCTMTRKTNQATECEHSATSLAIDTASTSRTRTIYWLQIAANYDRLTNDDDDSHFSNRLSFLFHLYRSACADDTATFKRNMILAFSEFSFNTNV